MGFQAVLTERELDFGREFAKARGLQNGQVTAYPRAVSPFNWTVYVNDELTHRYAHANLLHKKPLPAAPDFVGRMDAAFQAVWDVPRERGGALARV